MDYTEHDLVVARENVLALERFISEQERRFAGAELHPRQQRELNDLLQQFKQTLDAQRSLYQEIWTALQPGE